MSRPFSRCARMELLQDTPPEWILLYDSNKKLNVFKVVTLGLMAVAAGLPWYYIVLKSDVPNVSRVRKIVAFTIALLFLPLFLYTR